ncbi:MAG: hypothetical protein US35_C0014G0015 [Parcubacteria group bacterium GW2011_GWA2_37_10]|nr:MAG: hypothetical protein US35_C0014G0015 [Parcubacteria group bacterium GW2011_GWA2_37_10]HLD38084.1 DUF5655 domain-containing protein [Candidatus Nanoarchaeia archaeon]
MKSAIYMDGKRFAETSFTTEEDFEREVKENSQTLFGQKTIYLDIKNKIATKTLGNSIPDGFLFNFKNEDDPEFYLVEVELEKHDFDGHIFPQIKKFFTFFKNQKGRDELIGKLFEFIKQNPQTEQKFKEFLGNREIYKTIKDVVENNQNILLIIDENKPQFEETSDTITEWAKFVRVEILKKYTADEKNIFVLNPDFEEISSVEQFSPEPEKSETVYTENFHMEGVDQFIISIYNEIKDRILEIDTNIKINPTKYYISLRKDKNFVFFNIKRKKIWVSVPIPYNVLINIVKNYKTYDRGNYTDILIENNDNLEEIVKIIEEAYKLQN